MIGLNEEDIILIKNLCYFKGCGTVIPINESAAKGWKKHTLNDFICCEPNVNLHYVFSKNMIEHSEVYHLNFANVIVLMATGTLVCSSDN